MFKNALVYRIEHWDAPDLATIEERLDGARFVACGASEPESSGFVEPRGENHGALAESVGGQIILKLRAETKAVPGGVVKDELERRLDAIEQETGRRPKGKRAKELKDEIVRELLPRAFPKRSATMVWIAPQAGLVVIGVTGAKKADAIVTRLVELLGGSFRLGLAQTQLAPATAMAAWLGDKEAPGGFTIDRDCELKQPDSEKAAVRYARHTLELDEIGEHIRQGKLPTQLALTWNARVSFVLSESMALKKIKLLDGVLEQVEAQAQREGRDFDADVAIVTGELSKLIADLVEALGGWAERQEGVPAAAPAAAPAATAAGVAPWDELPA
ncbi:recombination-associated protein RdgC [Rubrivivax gelatinosus]|uniref:recombination-associated protein RdgC n=1 Tax=Rubrivivax gelatinosus TaxID=28068 RepID=UPI0019030D23|nr:recombination-associated protein RdgC [Rubrivivax gelatinosus]MBK1614874.1 recombination-associated protein RdgC [Rubrivivax gelatinosus]